MKQEPMQPQESLQLIDSMINKARNRFSENGHLYLIWGYTILICSIGQYLMEHVWHVKYFYLIWMLTWVVLAYQFFYIFKRNKQKTVTTYTDEIMRYVWMTFIIVMLLMLMMLHRISSIQHNADSMFLVLYGIPTFLSGRILKLNALTIGGIGCWSLSIISLTLPVQYHILLIAVAVVIAWIVPGYVLRQRFKIQH